MIYWNGCRGCGDVRFVGIFLIAVVQLGQYQQHPHLGTQKRMADEIAKLILCCVEKVRLLVSLFSKLETPS